MEQSPRPPSGSCPVPGLTTIAAAEALTHISPLSVESIMPPPNPPENWLLEIGGVGCNIYTGPNGQDGHLTELTSASEGRKAQVRFKCRWEDRNALLAGLLGTVVYQGGTIVRTPPFSYPTAQSDIDAGMFPNRLFCTDAGVEGTKWRADPDGSITGLAGWGYFVYAIVTATFTSPPYLIEPMEGGGPAFNDLTNNTYCISKLRVSGEVYSPPTGSYVWAEGSRAGKQVPDAHCGIVRPRYELSVTRMRMPIVPTTALDDCIGSVNGSVLQISTNEVDPEAALFMGYNPEMRTDPYNGGIVSDIEMLWAVNGYLPSRNADGSWNWFVDPVGQWSAIQTNDVNENPPFESVEHDSLFLDAIS